MSSETIVAIVIAFVGGSGLSTLIQVLFNRKKTQAETHALETDAVGGVLSTFTGAADKIVQASDRGLEIYSKALDMANLQIRMLEERVSKLEETLKTMEKDRDARNTTIAHLQRENADLRKELTRLEDAVKCRDKIIADLRKRIIELESKLETK